MQVEFALSQYPGLRAQPVLTASVSEANVQAPGVRSDRLVKSRGVVYVGDPVIGSGAEGADEGVGVLLWVGVGG